MAGQEHNPPVDNDDLMVDVQTEDEDIQVDIVDDTPEEDRGRKPLTTDPLASNDDEAVDYSEKVKKRMGELRHKAHDERRRAESAVRERDEAVRVAQEAYRRTKMLEQQLTTGEAAFAGETKQKADLQLAQARSKHNAAYEAGDPDKIAEAIAEIAAAAHAKQQAELWEQNATSKVKNALQQQDDDVDFSTSRQPVTKQAPTVEADPKALRWAEQNPWFGTDPEMTSLVYGVHEKLIKQGYDPDADAEAYYGEIDATMRRRYPEYEWDTADDDAPRKSASKPSQKAKPASVVAPVTRVASGGKKQITLTKTQVAIAKQLGITLEQYAREMLNTN